jgi:hypothetical protein
MVDLLIFSRYIGKVNVSLKVHLVDASAHKDLLKKRAEACALEDGSVDGHVILSGPSICVASTLEDNGKERLHAGQVGTLCRGLLFPPSTASNRKLTHDTRIGPQNPPHGSRR